MKQQDIALIIVVVAVSALLSFFVSNFLLGGTDRSTEVEVVTPIRSEFNRPNERFFNSSSLNPTIDIVIGDDGNQQPFNNSAN